MFPLYDVIPSRRKPYVTVSLIAINFIVFFYELSLKGDELQSLFFNFGLLPIRYIKHVDYFITEHFGRIKLYSPLFIPWFSSMFLHGNWWHIIGNMWTLWVFGDNVEDRMGHFRFLLFYILSGLAANFLHFVTNLLSPVPSLGASGAIAGVMGAYMFLFPFSRIVTFIPPFFIFELPAFLFLGIWFIMQFFNGLFSLITFVSFGGIAWWAHIGGFLFGAYFKDYFIRRRFYYY